MKLNAAAYGILCPTVDDRFPLLEKRTNFPVQKGRIIIFSEKITTCPFGLSLKLFSVRDHPKGQIVIFSRR
jgi:hypothetical protein